MAPPPGTQPNPTGQIFQMLGMVVFFIAGLVVLLKVDVERGQRDVSLQES